MSPAEALAIGTPIVDSLTRRLHRHPDYEDIRQEALIAVLRAAATWRAEGQTSFRSYAWRIILTAIVRTRRRESRRGMTPTLFYGDRPNVKLSSFDAPLDEEGNATLHDVIGVEGEQADRAELVMRRALVTAAAAKIKHGPEVMHARISGSTLQEAGRSVGLSCSRAGKIETDVIRRAQELAISRAA